MAHESQAHPFISASLPSSSGFEMHNHDHEEVSTVRRKKSSWRRDRSALPLPAAFLSRHQPALCLDPMLDASLLASFQPDWSGKAQQIELHRPIYTQREIDEQYEMAEEDFDCCRTLSSLRDKVQCSKERAIKVICNHLPIIDIVRGYNIREMLLIDLICGFTIGLVNLAHGITNSILANVSPTVGLYSSFYPVWMYTLFGTSKTMSFGTLSITSILVGNAVLDISSKILTSKTDVVIDNQTISYEEYKLLVQTEVAFCITFISGLVQLCAGVFRLGFMTVYFADAMVTGFTTATMIYVITSQVKHLLGLHFETPTGIGNIFLTWAKIFESLWQTNWIAVAMSVTAASVLLFFKFLINPALVSKIRAPFPIEALLMIVATIVSSELHLQSEYGVSCLGKMANGLPPPKVPNINYMDDSVASSFITAVINFAVSVSLAEVLARKNHTEIDPNQECFAYGVCNFVSSFFLCMPTGGGVSRSLVQDSLQPKTQLVGIVQSIVLLVVLLWITSFFSALPQCVLAVIVLVALSAIGGQFKEAWRLWHFSKVDCIIWVFSFTITVSLDIQIGLVLSILFSLLTLVVRAQLAQSHVLGNIPGTDLYKNLAAYKSAQEFDEIKIFRYCGEIHFACANQFRNSLYKKCGVNPKKVLARIRHEEEKKLLDPSYEVNFSLKFVVIDLSMCCYIDYGGLRVLKQVIDEYRAIAVTVFLAACPEPLQHSLIRAGFYETQDLNLVYVSVHDAVTFARTLISTPE